MRMYQTVVHYHSLNSLLSIGGYSASGSGGKYTGSTSSAISMYLQSVTAGENSFVPPNLTQVSGCGMPDPEKSTMGKRKPSEIDCPTDAAAIAKAVSATAAADTVMVAIGIDSSFEGENGDYRAIVADIGLPGSQLALVTAVAKAAKQPIVVLVTGSSSDLTQVKADPKVGAILWRGYAGEAAGQATADVLFGHYNPSGRLVRQVCFCY
eukprot:SAG31_NODE_7081_length_1794_cov_1.337463_2_plen_209_part_00